MMMHVMHLPAVVKPVHEPSHQPFNAFYHEKDCYQDKKEWQPVAISAK